MTNPIHPKSYARTAHLLTAMIAAFSAPLALADGVVYQAPAASPAPMVQYAAAQPTYAQPTYAQPTYAQPTYYYSSGYSQPTYAQPTYSQPTYAQPTYYYSSGYSQPAYAQPTYSQPAYAQPTSAQPTYAQPTYAQQGYQGGGGDPYGFTAWLNGVRAQNGRGPVSYDPGLAAQAASNNGAQQARGMGHHYMGSARRQNSGMGAAGTVWQMWMASPAHQAALLDPSITLIGIAASGAYWTFNAN